MSTIASTQGDKQPSINGHVGRGSAALVQFGSQEEADPVKAQLDGQMCPTNLAPILKVRFALEKKVEEKKEQAGVLPVLILILVSVGVEFTEARTEAVRAGVVA